MSYDLTAQRALIFRITHRDNIAWIFRNGLHCASAGLQNPSYVSIGNSELIERRHNHLVKSPPWGMLSDYVPFYFTPSSPMLLNIKTGWGAIKRRPNEEIVILVSSLQTLERKDIRFLYTDRHAYLATAQFFSDLANLDQIDWDILRNRDFKRDPDDPGKFERYQAEALVHKHLPYDGVLSVVCYSDSVVSILGELANECGVMTRIVARPGWYF